MAARTRAKAKAMEKARERGRKMMMRRRKMMMRQKRGTHKEHSGYSLRCDRLLGLDGDVRSYVQHRPDTDDSAKMWRLRKRRRRTQQTVRMIWQARSAAEMMRRRKVKKMKA